MSFKPENFAAKLNKSGVARASHFDVAIVLPNSLQGLTGGRPVTNVVKEVRKNLNDDPIVGPDDLTLRCDSVDFPGRSIQTSDYNTDYGPIRRIGHRSIYGDVTATFVLSEDLREKLLFETWQDLVVGTHRTGGEHYAINYYDDYVSPDITITQYDTAGQPRYKAQLIEAWPYIVNTLQGSWASDQVHHVTVSFAYRFYKSERNIAIKDSTAQTRTGNFLLRSGIAQGGSTVLGVAAGKAGSKATTAGMAAASVVGRIIK